MEALEGKIIGKCRIISKLDAGGMATIYRAEQIDLNREVAVKILPEHMAQQEGFIQRFQREAQAVANLEHQHILTIHDYGQQDGITYIVMPLIKGGTLKDRIKQGALTLTEIDSYFQQMCDALGNAHEHNIVHRDVKPANMLLTGRKNDWLLLADFGIAKALVSTEHLTSAGVGIGTPEYMSPEQMGGGQIGPYTDIYALGVVLYQLLTGRLPFTGNQYEIWLQHLQKPVPQASDLNPQVTPIMQAVIEKAMAKDPADRYATTEELATAFHTAIQEVTRTEPVRISQGQGATTDSPGSWPGSMTSANTIGQETPASGFSSQPEVTRYTSNPPADQTPILAPGGQPTPAAGISTASSAASSGSITAARKSPWIPVGIGAVVVLLLGGAAFGFFVQQQQQLAAGQTATAQAANAVSSQAAATASAQQNAVFATVTAIAAATAQAVNVPVKSGAQLISDPLSSDKGTFNLTRLSLSTVEFKNRQMVVNGGNDSTVKEVIVKTPLPSADLIVKTTITQIEGTNGVFGIEFHINNDANSGYYFAIDAGDGSYRLLRVEPGSQGVAKPVISNHFSSAINKGIGATNTLTVVTHGSHYEFYVNGEEIISYEGTPDVTSKKVGVFVTPQLAIGFSNFEVYHLP